MADRLTDPDFAPVFRGYDRVQVDAYVKDVRARLRGLEAEVNRLTDAFSETAIHPIPEYERIGKEVGDLLGEADRVATGMRERAAAEVEEWRATALAEAKARTDRASAEAEALRGDAWSTAAELLEESQAQATELVAQAEVAARSIRAEAEREAHRLVAGARREADEQIRVAKMEAERVVAEALAEKDEIVERARKTADAAQERARALEVRRDELLGELESVRATVQRLETDIEEKRSQLEPDPEPEPVEEPPEWGGGVRIIPARDDAVRVEELGEPVETLAVVEEVKRLRTTRPGDGHVTVVGPGSEESIEEKPESEGDGEPEPAPESQSEAEPEPEAVEHAGPVDELAGLFASLRGGTDAPQEAAAPGEPAPRAEPKPGSASPPEAVDDLLDHRQRVLLPITNGALRSIKRELADVQNRALEAIRLESEWTPSQTELAKQFEPLLRDARRAAFDAGWASTDVEGSPAGKPSKDRSTFAGDLTASLVRAAAKGSDPAASATEVSRAFRGWRSDSAARHLRSEATLAFNEGVAAAVRSEGGEVRLAVRPRGCVACRAEAGREPEVVPPFHPDCTCLVVSA